MRWVREMTRARCAQGRIKSRRNPFNPFNRSEGTCLYTTYRFAMIERIERIKRIYLLNLPNLLIDRLRSSFFYTTNPRCG
jgi:hypothetical protein